MGDEVLVLTDRGDKFGEEGVVTDVSRSKTLLVQDRDDSFVLLLHEVTDDLVVKVFHRLPLQQRGKIEHDLMTE